ncbi:MAG TPA: O-antigen ligase family protein [Candidatus Kapabacteria bacterium]|nr:O-antigen ligase family protein [Candidatus Kapabacteria bacterium]
MGDSLAILTTRTQVLLGAGVIAVLLLSFLITNSLLPIVGILGLVVMWVILRDPVYSIIGFIAINVIITLHPKADTIGGAPSGFELVLGFCLVSIIGYWIFRIRIFEWSSLSESPVQISLMLFFVWSILVTIGGVILNQNSPAIAVRELLNLLPLLIMPVLYVRFIIPGSKAENWLFASVLFSGCLFVIGSVFQIRSNIVQAYYLFQTGKGTIDITLAPFIIAIIVSYLMVEKQPWRIRAAILLILLEATGVAISLSRNSYVATPIASMIVLSLGSWKERKRGGRRILLIAGIASVAVIIMMHFSRILSLLVKSYLHRLVTTQRLGHDLALRERLAEWSGEWFAIKQSPIVGHGFGSSFRAFDLGRGVHTWMNFSHSSYLYIIFKTGIIGTLLFFIPFFTFLYNGFKLARTKSLPDRSRIVARGCVGALIILLFAAYLGPVFDSKTDLMWVGLIWGYFLALERQIHANATDLNTSFLPI